MTYSSVNKFERFADEIINKAVTNQQPRPSDIFLLRIEPLQAQKVRVLFNRKVDASKSTHQDGHWIERCDYYLDGLHEILYYWQSGQNFYCHVDVILAFLYFFKIRHYASEELLFIGPPYDVFIRKKPSKLKKNSGDYISKKIIPNGTLRTKKTKKGLQFLLRPPNLRWLHV